MSGVLRLLVARTPTFILLTAALSVAGAPVPAWAAAKTAIEIVPGAKSISPEENAMTADPARGSQHGTILVDESVRDESTGTETNLFRHVRAKIFSNEGRRLGDIEIEHVRDRGLLKKWWGFTLLPDGTVLETKQSDLKEQELASTRGRAFVALKTSLPGIVPGSVIDYGYVLQEPGFYSTTRVDIQREAPVKLFRCRWVPYIGATASFGLLHTEGLSVTMTRDQRSVLVTGADLPAVLDEPYMPPDSESRASALFYYRRSGSKPKDFWDLEAQRLIRRATTFTKEKPIAQAMLSIKFPAGADLMTKLRAAYDWASVTLRNTTRRTAEEAEAVRADDKEKPEAWKTAQDILAAGEGSARDLDFLFFGLARALGAEAFPVLAADRTDHYFNPGFLSIEQFDWTLVAVKAKGDPDDKLVFVDPGSGLPFGEIPWWLAGSRAFLASAEGHRVVTLPVSDPRKNVSETYVKISFNLDEGTSPFTTVTDNKVQRGLSARWRLRGLGPEERAKELENYCGASGDIEVSKAQAPNLEDATADYHLKCEGSRMNSNFHRDLGGYHFGFMGPWVEETPRFTSPTRTQNVVFSYPRIDHLILDVEAPPGFVPSGAQTPPTVESAFGRYALLISVTPEGYHVERLYALTAVAVLVKDYDPLRQFFEEVARADATSLGFKRAPGP